MIPLRPIDEAKPSQSPSVDTPVLVAPLASILRSVFFSQLFPWRQDFH